MRWWAWPCPAWAGTAPWLLPAGTLRARRGLPAVVAVNGVAGAAFFSAEVFIPLMLSSERGFSPAAAGLALTIGTVSWSASSWYQGRPNQPFTRTRLLQVGMAAIGIGVGSVPAGSPRGSVFVLLATDRCACASSGCTKSIAT